MLVQDMVCTQPSPNTLSEPEYSSVSPSPPASHQHHNHHNLTHHNHHTPILASSPASDFIHPQTASLIFPLFDLNAHAPDSEDLQWPGRAPIGSLSHSARQPAPAFPPRRAVSASSLTPAHTPILTPAHEHCSLSETSSSSSRSSSLSSTTTSTSASNSAYSSGSSSRNNRPLPYAMSRIPQVGHAPVSAALQAQALEAMYERPSERNASSSPPPEGAATAPGAGAGSGYGSAGAMNNGISSRRAGASHRRRSHGHGPMRTPVRPHTPSMSPHGGPTPPNRKPGTSPATGMYNQPTRAFVLERLHEYAPAALSNPRTSDVRIVVPSRPNRQHQPPESRRGTHPPTPESASASDAQSTPMTPNGVAAQPAAAAAAQATVPVRFYALHRDYLVPQSALFRNILTGGFKDGSPEAKGCKLLPYTSLHGPRPVFVPLPDPESFDALVHWMYFGDVAKLESQLSSGEVKWRGLIRNIQYLGCDERTRTVVAKWWQRWAQSDRRIGRPKEDQKAKDDSDDEHADGVPVPRRRGPRPVDDDDDDDDERESSYDNADDKLSSPWRSAENLSYSVDADEMTRRLGGL